MPQSVSNGAKGNIMNFIFNVLLCLVACAIIMVLLVVYTAMNVFSMHNHPHLHGGVMPHPDELNEDKEELAD